MKRKRGFGIRGDQYPPTICSDCGKKLSEPIFDRLGSWHCLCTCGANYVWSFDPHGDRWKKSHVLPLFRLVYQEQQ